MRQHKKLAVLVGLVLLLVTIVWAQQPVSIVAGTAVIGHIILDASSAVIGHVIVDSGALTTQGAVAESSAQTQNPLANGGTSVTADKTATHNGDAVGFVSDTTGKQIVMPYANPENFLNGATSDITSTTATSIIAGVASNHLYITSFCVMNSHASVDTWVNLTEETSGTVLYTVFALHGGGGACQTLPAPIRLPTAAKAIQVTCVTTGANVRASAAGYKAVQ